MSAPDDGDAFACGPQFLSAALSTAADTIDSWRKEIEQRHRALTERDRQCFRAELRGVATMLHGLVEAETEQ